MKSRFLKRKLSCLVALTCMASAAQQAAYAAPIELNFESIKERVPRQNVATRAHFVRLSLKSLSVWEKEQTANGAVALESRKNYIASLEDAINKKIEVFEAAGYITSSPMYLSDVGFTIVATDADARSMKGVDGIDTIIAKQAFTPQRNYSTPWVGGTAVHESGYTGAGQVVAIIDTGVDYVHKDFKGTADYSGNDPAVVEPGSFPTERVVGGFDFAGFDYDARFPETSTPQPDNDPMDDGTHGTHVAGIAAGTGYDGILGAGIAPEAGIMALKVFGAEGSTSLTADAIEYAMDPNGDGDMSDAVDVINMSLGSAFGDPNAPSSIAAQNASESGIVVVASAGNSGNGNYYISGSPGAAPGVITVASTLPGGVPAFFVPFTSTSGESFEFFAQYSGISPPLETSIMGNLVVAEPYDACTPLSNAFNDQVALITRGACAFTTKLQNALDAGASAAIVVNNVAGAAIVMGGTDVDLPGAMITLSDGDAILAELGASFAVATELAFENEKPFPDDDDTMSSFSSRGPGPTGIFKPDVAAPGSLIESALSGSGEGTLTISGTSMAAPQVAGMAAVLKERFPELSAPAIKAIIQNTAYPASDPNSVTGTPPLSLQGTGVIDIERAVAATSYASPGGIGFGRINPEYNETVIRSFTVTNFSDEGKRYRMSVEPNLTLPAGAAQLTVDSEIYLAAGQSQTVSVRLNLQANAMVSDNVFTELDGWIVVSSGEEEMRVGYQAVVDPASRLNYSAQGDRIDIRNEAFGDAEVYAYTFVDGLETGDSELVGDFGFRLTSPSTVEFGLNGFEGWTNFSRKMLEVEIDVDEDGVSDYLAQVADLAYFTTPGGDPDGRIASAILDLNNPEAQVQLLYLATAQLNNSVLSFQLDTYGAFGFLADDDTTFSYTMSLSDRFNGNEDGVQSGTVDLADNVSFDIPAMFIPAQQGVSVQVGSGAETLWLSPSENTIERRSVVK